MEYTFLAPSKVVFGSRSRLEIGTIARLLGARAFVVWGSRTLERLGVKAEIEESMREAGLEVIDAGSISREPEVADVDAATRFLRESGARSGDVVVAIGGGSAVDLGKAIAALAVDGGETVVDYLEGVGTGRQLTTEPLPFVAVPTTGGTGSEATKNSVVSSYDPTFKKSLRSDAMVANAVVIDPQFGLSVPPDTTAWTGMDAITQLIESYISGRAKPVPRALAIDGLAHAAAPAKQGDEISAPAIVEAFQDPRSEPARARMAHAAYLSGLALANSGLGMAHGVAAALGVHNRVPHGLACAALLPCAMRTNRDVRRRDMARIGEVISGRTGMNESEAANAAIDAVDELCAKVFVPPRLSDLGVERAQIPAIVTSSRGNSMSGNPRELTDEELTTILEDLL